MSLKQDRGAGWQMSLTEIVEGPTSKLGFIQIGS